MKKLFFFRSSVNNENINSDSPPSTDKKAYWEAPQGGGRIAQGDKAENSFRSSRGLFSRSRKQVCDSQSSTPTSALRRSRSLSSASFLFDGLGQGNFHGTNDQIRSPSSSTCSGPRQKSDLSSRRPLTPVKQGKAKQFEVAAVNAHGQERAGSSCSSKSHHNSSGDSSCSNVSSKVLDRYIDGEQHQERGKPKSSCSQRNLSANGNAGGRLPPRVQYTAPSSPTESVKDKPKSRSFREAKGTRLHFSSRDWVENGFGHESPRRLARNVIERLSQTRGFTKSNLKGADCDFPITIEDVYGGAANKCFHPDLDHPAQKSYSLEEPYEMVDRYHGEDCSSFQKQNRFLGEKLGDVNSSQFEDNVDMELQRRSKEAEERVVLLSEELEEEIFLQDNNFDVPSLIRTIRSLREDKISLAIEVSGLLKSRIAERDYAEKELTLAKTELDSRTRKLEKEKNELQTALEKELDRRSSDWSSKLEKYQLEERRLRERVRELAEQNVSLQREVSSFNEREMHSKSAISHSEQQLRHLTSRVGEVDEENQNLSQNLSELQEKYTTAEQDLVCIKRNFEEKDNECKELQKSITRLLRTCSEREKTIEGLHKELGEEIEKRQSLDKYDMHVTQLQLEQRRLVGIELALSREVESCRLEIEALRHENISLLNRLKGNGRELDALTFKLDKEIRTRVCWLQNQGLSMLNESIQLCSKLVEHIKGKACQLPETEEGIQLVRKGLDGQFLVESDIKIQSLKHGTESLTRSLRTMSSVLQEKSNLVASNSPLPCTEIEGSGKLNNQTAEEAVRFELKAETLIASLLREKLYSKELEVEQLQAELAAAVRGNDILRCEALDNLSRLTHKLKDIELQMLKKDEYVGRLEIDLEDSSKELTRIKGILPKVSQERDMMWEEVKRYNEKNMLLNSEVNLLKKKIEALDEDILLKEGQITILKDTLGNRPFDLLSDDSTQEFLLR